MNRPTWQPIFTVLSSVITPREQGHVWVYIRYMLSLRERDRDSLCRDRMAEGHVFKGRIAVSSAAGYAGADWYINIALIFPFLPSHDFHAAAAAVMFESEQSLIL